MTGHGGQSSYNNGYGSNGGYGGYQDGGEQYYDHTYSYGEDLSKRSSNTYVAKVLVRHQRQFYTVVFALIG